MNQSAEAYELSELELIEFHRREDIAYAVVEAGIRVLGELDLLQARLAIEEKKANSFWYLVFFALAIGLHYLLAGNKFELNIGTWLFAWIAFAWYAQKRDVAALYTKRDGIYQRIADMTVTWNSVAAGRTFWDMKAFVSELEFDPENAAFIVWWAKQRERILQRVCGSEKISSIPGTQAHKSKEALRQFRGE